MHFYINICKREMIIISLYQPCVLYVCFQFRGYAISTVLCGWNPWASDPQMSEGETTIASLNKNQKILPKESVKE